MREKDRERERQRERKKERGRERGRDRKKERERERQRETERESEREKERARRESKCGRGSVCVRERKTAPAMGKARLYVSDASEVDESTSLLISCEVNRLYAVVCARMYT